MPRIALARLPVVTVFVVLAALVLGVAAVRYPISVHIEPVGYAACFGGLALYATIAWFLARQPERDISTVGTAVGVPLAMFAAAYHTAEMSGKLSGTTGAIFGPLMWALLFIGFGTAAHFGSRRATIDDPQTARDVFAKIQLGVTSALVAAMVYAAGIVMFAIAYAIADLPSRASPGFGPPEMAARDAAVVASVVANGPMHLFGSLLVATFIGAIGAFVTARLMYCRKSVQSMCTWVGIGLLIAGVFSLVHVTSLPRPERPPFVMFGLAAMGAALSAGPALIGILFLSTKDGGAMRG